MSSYQVVQHTSTVLTRLLRDSIAASEVPDAAGQQIDVSANTPTEVIRSGKGQLSFWLYRVTENAFNRNGMPGRPSGQGLPPLLLDLHFLATPLSKSADIDLMLIGKVLQVMHETPIILLRNDDDPNLHDQLTIQFERMGVDEQSRIWEALSEPYRMSVSYLVQVVRVDAEAADGGTPIVDREAILSGPPGSLGG